MNQRRAIAAGILLAFIASAFGAPRAYEYCSFMTRPELREREEGQIKSTINFFSSTLAGFYSIGEPTSAGLNQFPAEKMIKRRLFQDIKSWKDEERLLVMDRDKSTVRSIRFVAPDRAVAVVDENWFSAYQDLSRRPVSDKKADMITVRYFLKKTGGLWIVMEYEVYPQGDQLPSFPEERFAKW